jgi:exodeoxyribonuclease VII large subunit
LFLMLDFRESSAAPLTVSQLTRRMKAQLEGNFSHVNVAGEVSNFTVAASGHWYFSLKDAGAKIDAVLWAGTARTAERPQVGDAVVADGKISVYEPRGAYQLVVTSLHRAGDGDARAQRLALIEKLRAAGYLAPERKKEIPLFARVFGLVTSPAGAAARDFIKVLRKRFPAARIVLAPCLVQGTGAAADIAAAMKRLDRAGICDVILVGRGGGAAEDLAAFDAGGVALAVAECATPIISAVGHEIDTAVCDLVADVRAATPSEAAEIATRQHPQMPVMLANLLAALRRAMDDFIAGRYAGLQALQMSVKRKHPAAQIRRQCQQCDELHERLNRTAGNFFARRQAQYRLLEARLAALNPRAVLRRGFSITRNAAGKIIKSPAKVARGERLRIALADGDLAALVE